MKRPGQRNEGEELLDLDPLQSPQNSIVADLDLTHSHPPPSCVRAQGVPQVRSSPGLPD